MAERRWAVVTGTSSGVGDAVAGRLAAAGLRVFGARRAFKLQAKGEIQPQGSAT